VTTQVETLVRRRRRRTALARRVSHFSRWVTVATGFALIAATGLVTWALVQFPVGVPWTVFAPIAVLAGLFLTPRWIAVVYGAIVLGFAWSGWEVAAAKSSYAGSGVVLVLVGASMLWLAQSRARLGVQGTLGESMLVDLRDRLRAHGELPDLPHPWHAETALESAYGHAFSGDFIVANRSHDGSRLEVTLVDVSGKGVNAGTKALLLSGALGGLLGEMSEDSFLQSANNHLLRLRWHEGFATAVHVALDLESGNFTIGYAGHPAAAQFAAGSGRWRMLSGGRGPLLGVIDHAVYPRELGTLRRGDALVLYSDGVIESPDKTLGDGIDRMLGRAESFVRTGFEGLAQRLCDQAAAGLGDDRAVVTIWRT